jgi:hypothetical protein
VFLSAARVLNTFLLDGVVYGTWQIVKGKEDANLRLDPFAPLPDADYDALMAEGRALLAFATEKDAARCTITIVYKA